MAPSRLISCVTGTLAAVAALSAGLPASSQGGAPPRLDDVVNATRRYVSDYEAKLTLIVADESYVQRALEFGSRSARPPRLLKSEMFFAFTPATSAAL
jgi:hypothetical protein